MKRYEEEIEQTSSLFMWLTGRWILFLFLLGIGLTALTYWLKPVWLGFERKAFVASHQYQEAHLTQLANLKEKKAELEVELAKTTDTTIEEALRGQIEAIKIRIKTEERKLSQ